MNEDFTKVFDEIMRRHGLGADDVVSVSIARALARELHGDEIDPAVVTSLTALLPPAQPKPPPQDEFDVLRLSDRDRAELRRLIMIGTGKVPPTAAGWKPRSARLRGALRLIEVLDAVERRIETSARPLHGEATRAECSEIYARFNQLLIGCGVTGAGLMFAAGVRSPAEAPSVVLPPIETQPAAPPPEQTNVIPLQRSASPLQG